MKLRRWVRGNTDLLLVLSLIMATFALRNIYDPPLQGLTPLLPMFLHQIPEAFLYFVIGWFAGRLRWHTEYKALLALAIFALGFTTGFIIILSSGEATLRGIDSLQMVVSTTLWIFPGFLLGTTKGS